MRSMVEGAAARAVPLSPLTAVPLSASGERIAGTKRRDRTRA